MNLRSIADFLFEVGMLKLTPRTGFQFLGSGRENVAEHSFRCATVGYALARMAGVRSPEKVVMMCLFHDLAEARTGDLNYVNKKYVTADEEAALHDMTVGLPFGEDIRRLTREFRDHMTEESLLANDADQLDLMLQLKELEDLGNPYCKYWISSALKRLRTDAAKRLAQSILETEFCNWWFRKREDDWWVNGGRQELNHNEIQATSVKSGR